MWVSPRTRPSRRRRCSLRSSRVRSTNTSTAPDRDAAPCIASCLAVVDGIDDHGAPGSKVLLSGRPHGLVRRHARLSRSRQPRAEQRVLDEVYREVHAVKFVGNGRSDRGLPRTGQARNHDEHGPYSACPSRPGSRGPAGTQRSLTKMAHIITNQALLSHRNRRRGARRLVRPIRFRGNGVGVTVR